MNYRNKLLKKVLSIVRDYSKVAETRAMQEWSRYSVEGEAHFHTEAKELTSAISAFVYAYGQKAWILEYGRGSEMETNSKENPFLDEYLRDNRFNKARFAHALAITGRPRGYYTDLDGNRHHSSGTLEGKNIENWMNTGDYLPMKPKKIIYHILFGSGEDGLISEMQKDIQKAMEGVLGELLDTFPKEIRL